MSLRQRLVMVAVLAGVATFGAAAALVVSLARPVAGAGWQVGLVVTASMALVTAFAAMIVAIATLHGVAEPLAAVADAAAWVASGSFHVDVGGQVAPEVQAVAGALDEAARDVRESKRELDGTRVAFRQAVTRLGEVLASTHDFEGIVDAIVETALLVVPGDSAVYYTLVASPDHLEATHAHGAPGNAVLLAGSGLAGAAARAGRVATVSTAARGTVVLAPADLDAAEPRARTGIAAPLFSLGRLVGVLAVYGSSVGRPFSEEETASLLSLLRQAELAVANIQLHEEARREALTDDVTGLWNRRHFDIRLGEAVAVAHRYGEPFSVAIFDLDDFKRINDRWDHLTGDAALVHFATLLRSTLREVDVACRWGGEEFAVLLQRAGAVEALKVAQRVVELVRTTPMARGRHLVPFTVSAGVATFPLDGDDGSAVLSRADAALLRAKAAGKDRVERAQGTATGPLVVDVTDRRLAEPEHHAGPQPGLPHRPI